MLRFAKTPSEDSLLRALDETFFLFLEARIHARLFGFNFVFLYCCDYYCGFLPFVPTDDFPRCSCPQHSAGTQARPVLQSPLKSKGQHSGHSSSEPDTCCANTSLRWGRGASLPDSSSYLEKMRLCKHKTSETTALPQHEHFSFSSSSLRPALAPFASRNPCTTWWATKPSTYSFHG